MAQVRGTKIREKLAYVENHLGKPAREKILAGLPAADRAALQPLLEGSWYPIGIYDRLLRSIVIHGADGDGAILDAIGTHAAEYQARRSYAIHFKSGDVGGLLRAMAPMHRLINDPGEMEVRTGDDGLLSLVVKNPPTTAEACRVALAFYRRAVSLCNGGRYKIEETRCMARGDEHCQFDIRQ